jgi:uncharacterized protein
MSDEKILKTIKKELFAVPMINTHDHVQTQKKMMEASKNKSFLYNLMLMNNNNGLLSYLPDEAWRMAEFSADYNIGATQNRKYYTAVGNLSKMWKKLEPVIHYAKGSNHYRVFMRACRDLFNLGYDHIDNEKKWIELSEKIAEANQKEEWYRYVLKEKANIEKTILLGRSTPKVEKEYFVPGINLGDFLIGYDGGILSSLEEKYKGKVQNFDDYVDLLDRAFRTIVEQGTITLKDRTAYTRSIDFKNVTKRDALKGFEPIVHHGFAIKSISSIDINNFQDYMMFQIAKGCSKYNIPIQIHTGPPAPIAGAHPLLLMELIESNPDTKFVILHLGPRADEFAIAAAFNSNVYIDFAWSINSLGPSGFKRILGDWLEIMPWDKFMFGADGDFVENTYGMVITARELISEVLAEKVQNGFISINTAIEIGNGILRDNAKKLYKL